MKKVQLLHNSVQMKVPEQLKVITYSSGHALQYIFHTSIKPLKFAAWIKHIGSIR